MAAAKAPRGQKPHKARGSEDLTLSFRPLPLIPSFYAPFSTSIENHAFGTLVSDGSAKNIEDRRASAWACLTDHTCFYHNR